MMKSLIVVESATVPATTTRTATRTRTCRKSIRSIIKVKIENCNQQSTNSTYGRTAYHSIISFIYRFSLPVEFFLITGESGESGESGVDVRKINVIQVKVERSRRERKREKLNLWRKYNLDDSIIREDSWKYSGQME